MHGTIIKPPAGSQVDLLHPHNRGCVAWYPMWEGSGSKIYNALAPSRHVGTLTNFTAGSEWKPGRDGHAVQFDGSDDRVVIPRSSQIEPARFTLSAWVKTTKSSGEQCIFDKPNTSHSDPFYSYHVRFSGTTLRFYAVVGGFSAADGIAYSNGINEFLNKWGHLAVSFDESKLVLYVNGRKVDELNNPGSVAYFATDLTLGYFQNFTGPLQGNLSDVRIYNRALSQAEIVDLMRQPWASVIGWDGASLVPVFGGGEGLTHYTLVADHAEFSLSGQVAGLLAARNLAADSGSLSLSGQDAGFLRTYQLAADDGNYSLAGQDAGVLYGRTMAADQGSYSLTGQDADFDRTRALQADHATFTLSGQDADFMRTVVIAADFGSYQLNGQDADLFVTAFVATGHIDITTPFLYHVGEADNIPIRLTEWLDGETITSVTAVSDSDSLVVGTPSVTSVVYTIDGDVTQAGDAVLVPFTVDNGDDPIARILVNMDSSNAARKLRRRAIPVRIVG